MATKTAKAKPAGKVDENTIMAYNVKLKEKEQMFDPVISNHNNRFIAKGKSKDGKSVLCVAIGRERAEKLIKAKQAKKGEGWE